jgi:hypothetical protein
MLRGSIQLYRDALNELDKDKNGWGAGIQEREKKRMDMQTVALEMRQRDLRMLERKLDRLQEEDV